MARSPLISTRTAGRLAWLEHLAFRILPPLLLPSSAGVWCSRPPSHWWWMSSHCLYHSPVRPLPGSSINPPSGCSMGYGYQPPYLLLQFNKLVMWPCWYKIHMYWIWLSWGCSCMSNLLALVAGTTLDYCVRVLLMGSLCAHFFGNVSAVTYIASRQKLYSPTHHLLHALSCTTSQNRNLCHSGTLSNYKEQFPCWILADSWHESN